MNGRWIFLFEKSMIMQGNSKEGIISLKDVAFDEQLIAQREKILLRHYNNRNNAAEIVTFLQQRSL